MQLLVAHCYRWQGRENRDLGLKKKRPCWVSYPLTASYCSTKVGAASSPAVSSDTAFSAAFFFFFAAFGLAEVFSSFRISASIDLKLNGIVPNCLDTLLKNSRLVFILSMYV